MIKLMNGQTNLGLLSFSMQSVYKKKILKFSMRSTYKILLTAK